MSVASASQTGSVADLQKKEEKGPTETIREENDPKVQVS